MWVALIPLLCALLVTTSPREIVKLAAVSSLLGRMTTLVPFVQEAMIVRSPAVAVPAILFVVPFAVPLVVIGVLWRFVVRDTRAWHSAVAFSLIAAAVDLLFATISSHGSWSSWANSQMNVLPVLQNAALGGTPLVVFIVTLPAATAAVAVVHGGSIRSPGLAYGLPLSLTIAAIGYGYARLENAPAMARIPVGLVASDTADPLPPDPGGAADPTLAAYLQRATMLATRGAELVMLPEKIEIFNDDATGRVRHRLSTWARDHQTRLLAGFGIVTPERRDNVAWLFDRNGDLMTQYAKQHLVPFLEMRFHPGDRDAVVELDGYRFGIAICKDLGFPRLARRYGRSGIDAMLTPAWDFGADGEYHARVAVLRGIEQGFSVIRTANQGMLTASDPYGRIVAEVRSNEAPVTTLLADAPIGSVPTLYRTVGDVFGWACVVLVAVLWISRTRIEAVTP